MTVVYLDKGVRRVKKIIIYILLGISILIVITLAVFSLRILFDLANPLRQSVEYIREEVLSITPIGMNMEDAIVVLEATRSDRNWGQLRVNNRVGVTHGELGLPRRPEDIALNRGTTVGEYSLRMSLGGYRNFFATGIHVWWAFDEDLELIEVFVQKQISGW